MPRLKIGKVVGASGESLEPSGVYDPFVTYNRRDLVTYNNSSYVALKETTGNPPTNTMFWQLNAEGVGGTANDVEYDNSKSQIKSTTVQLAIDELNELIQENASSIPEGATYVPSESDGEIETVNPSPIDADLLEGHGADYFAAKTDIPEPTEPWDYTVKYPKKITLKNSAGEDIGWIQPNNDKSYSLISANDNTAALIGEDGLVTTLHGYQLKGGGTISGGTEAALQFLSNNIIKVLQGLQVASGVSVRFANSAGGEKYRFIMDADENLLFQADVNNAWTTLIKGDKSGGIIDIPKGVISGLLSMPNTIPIYFRNTSNTALYRMLSTATNNYEFQALLSNAWQRIVAINEIGNIFIYNILTISYGNSLAFQNSSNTQQFRFILDSGNRITLQYYSGNEWKAAYYISLDGIVHFTRNIDAPNIASTAALMKTQQEITDQDIKDIETKQQITDLELQVLALSAQVEKNQSTQNNETNITTTTQEVE